jgi:hypothetical protein
VNGWLSCGPASDVSLKKYLNLRKNSRSLRLALAFHPDVQLTGALIVKGGPELGR